MILRSQSKQCFFGSISFWSDKFKLCQTQSKHCILKATAKHGYLQAASSAVFRFLTQRLSYIYYQCPISLPTIACSNKMFISKHSRLKTSISATDILLSQAWNSRSDATKKKRKAKAALRRCTDLTKNRDRWSFCRATDSSLGGEK